MISNDGPIGPHTKGGPMCLPGCLGPHCCPEDGIQHSPQTAVVGQVIVYAEDGILIPAQPGVVAVLDPAAPEAVLSTNPPIPVCVITSHEGWTMRRVYSQYLSREVFTDPAGIEWVRISRERFNPATDIEVEIYTRGVGNMLLRRRNAAAANLRRGEIA